MKTLFLTAVCMLAATTAFAQDISATGKVVSVDAEAHALKLTHDPITSLGWPAMTMNFNVEKGVDLSGYHSGDAVSFTLKPLGKDDYIVSGIQK